VGAFDNSSQRRVDLRALPAKVTLSAQAKPHEFLGVWEFYGVEMARQFNQRQQRRVDWIY
jgi:hypothetical protein